MSLEKDENLNELVNPLSDNRSPVLIAQSITLQWRPCGFLAHFHLFPITAQW